MLLLVADNDEMTTYTQNVCMYGCQSVRPLASQPARQPMWDMENGKNSIDVHSRNKQTNKDGGGGGITYIRSQRKEESFPRITLRPLMYIII